MRFVVDVEEDLLQDSRQETEWFEAIKENLDFSNITVRKYDEPWEEVPLDRLLNKLTVYMRSGKDSSLVKDWAKVLLKEELKDAFEAGRKQGI